MPITKQCKGCSADFVAQRANTDYCSPAHRQAAYRERRRAKNQADRDAAGAVTAGIEPPGSAHPIADATAAELKLRQLEGSAVGLVAVALARAIDRYGPGDSLSALGTVGKVHAELMTKHLGAGAADDGDRGDELARRRAERRRAATGG